MTTPLPEPTVTATRYTVSCLPPDHCGYSRSIVAIECRDRVADPSQPVWAVTINGWIYDRDGEPSIEPMPSERHRDWIARHRHDLDTALSIAKLIARTVAADLTEEARDGE